MLLGAGFVLVSLIWGSTWLAIKIGLQSVPPLFAVTMRFSLATIILFLILKIRGERLPTDRVALLLYLTLAFLSYSFPFALVYWGEQYIPSGLASIIFAVYPFVVAIGSHFALEAEKMNVLKMAGILLGFAGVTIIFWSDIHPGEIGRAHV
jgi:drug/metabolite transporter (DMT)-like permease